MKIYTVVNRATDYQQDFQTLAAAKAAMKAHNAKGYITKIYSNGDFVDCGEITLKGSNKTYIANTRQTVASY